MKKKKRSTKPPSRRLVEDPPQVPFKDIPHIQFEDTASADFKDPPYIQFEESEDDDDLMDTLIQRGIRSSVSFPKESASRKISQSDMPPPSHMPSPSQKSGSRRSQSSSKAGAFQRPASKASTPFTKALSSKVDAPGDDWMASIFDNFSGKIPDKDADTVSESPRKKKKSTDSSWDDYPDDQLDLHGKTRDKALRILQRFVDSAIRRNCRTILIVTGKGLHSGSGGPVLKEAVQDWLNREGARYIRTFREAPKQYGGDGAIWVELARR